MRKLGVLAVGASGSGKGTWNVLLPLPNFPTIGITFQYRVRFSLFPRRYAPWSMRRYLLRAKGKLNLASSGDSMILSQSEICGEIRPG